MPVSVECEPLPAEHDRRRGAVPPLPRRLPRLRLASAALAAPGWLGWAITHRGLRSAVVTSVILVANVVVTRLLPSLKLRAIRMWQRYVLNPVVRVLLSVGVLPLGLALLETTGRHSGRPRRTPV